MFLMEKLDKYCVDICEMAVVSKSMNWLSDNMPTKVTSPLHA